MAEPRELRSIVPAEVAAVLLVAFVPLPESLPIALPLLVVASLSRWLRRRSWGDVVVMRAEHVAVGAAAGAVALGLALVVGTPLVEGGGTAAVQWSQFPIVRGNAQTFAIVALYVAAMSIALELALRGWIVERVLELSPGPIVLPVLVGAIAEAVVTPGDVGVRAGAALFGAALGWMYVAGGRSIVAPLCARLVFQLGALSLEALRVIG